MLVRNENLQLVQLSAYADELIREGFGEEVVTEEDAQNALAELYFNSYAEQSQLFFHNISKFDIITIENVNKFNLWKSLKEIFCSIVQEDSVFGKVIEFIIEAIAQLIPMGVFIKKLVKTIIKYFLQKGVNKICS